MHRRKSGYYIRISPYFKTLLAIRDVEDTIPKPLIEDSDMESEGED